LLQIELSPSDERDFKLAFLSRGLAIMTVYYADERIEQREWGAVNFSMSAKVLKNLRSRPQFRQGVWQRLGIRRVEVTVAT
jgi:hypothetical protein